MAASTTAPGSAKARGRQDQGETKDSTVHALAEFATVSQWTDGPTCIRCASVTRVHPVLGAECPGCAARLPDGYLTLQDLRADPARLQPPNPVVPRLAWRGRVTLLAAREKVGKSTLAGCGAAALTQGRPFLGEPTSGPAAALWCSYEEHPADLDERFKRFGADPADLYLGIRPDRPLETLEAAVLVVEPELVVIDTLASLVSGVVTEGGSSAQWQPVLTRLCRIAQAPGGPAVVIVHHARKSDGTYRDSTAIGAAVDVILEVAAPALFPGIRSVSARGRFAIEPYSYGLTEDGRDVLLTASGGGEDDLEAAVEKWVGEHEGATMNQVRRGVAGRGVAIDNAIEKLINAGRVTEAPGKRGARLLFSAAPEDTGS